MDHLFSNTILAISTFAITNIDDLLLLSLYFSKHPNKTKQIVGGQYLGILCIVVISLCASTLGYIIAPGYISFLGIIPVFIGLKDLYQHYYSRNGEQDLSDKNPHSLQPISVAMVTFANGGDNIGVYTPLFAGLHIQNIYLYLFIFILMTGLWCLFARYLVRHKRLKKHFARYGKTLLPFFLIVMGLCILFK